MSMHLRKGFRAGSKFNRYGGKDKNFGQQMAVQPSPPQPAMGAPAPPGGGAASPSPIQGDTAPSPIQGDTAPSPIQGDT